MTPLGALDALFLYLETTATPMHVGALYLLDRPGGTTDFTAALRRHVGARLHCSPVFTRRLQMLPLSIASPLWVAAGDVDLEQHVRHLKLPAPAGREQLHRAVAALHAQPLDRGRPLWRMDLIEGLRDRHLALYVKVHHAAVDGLAGVALAQALFDDSPQPHARPHEELPPAHRRAALPAPDSPLVAALLENGRAALGLLESLPSLARSALAAAPGAAALARSLRLAPSTSLAGTIDSGRRVATASLPLATVRAIAQANSVTVNDVVLALVGAALRGYFAAHGELPTAPLIAAMPVSLREAGDAAMNTQATMAQASLATDIADPLERLQAIHRSAATAKTASRALRPPAELRLPSLGLPWLLSAAAALYGGARIADRLPPLANVVVSNIPGPEAPLYLAGAKLAAYWPLSIVTHGLALNITVQRYGDSLDFGLVGARKRLADPAAIADALAPALDELARASHIAPVARRRPRRTEPRDG